MGGWNGGGSVTLTYDWTDDAANAIAITASRFDTQFADVVSALENCYTLDSQTTPTADLAMGGYHLTGLAAGSAANDSVRLVQVQDSAMKYATASGTDTYTISLTPNLTAYAAGQTFRVLFTNANTGAATLNVDSAGAKAITKNGTTALAAGDIPAGSIWELCYDGTQFQLVGQIVVSATDAAEGLVELATDTEAKAVTATDKVVTPGNLAAVFAEPPAIGNTTAAAVTGTTVTASTEFSGPGDGITVTVSTEAGTSYTFDIDDAGVLMQFTSGSAVTATVPPNSSVAYPTGTVIAVEQNGAGQVTLAAGAGVTLNGANGLATAAQYSVVCALKVATNTWTVFGDATS